MGILNYLLKRNQIQGNQDQNGGYYDSGYGSFGNTDPSFWSNPQDQARGPWGSPQSGGFSLMGGYQAPTNGFSNGFSLSPGGFQQGPQQYSLLDILSRLMQPQIGTNGGW